MNRNQATGIALILFCILVELILIQLDLAHIIGQLGTIATELGRR